MYVCTPMPWCACEGQRTILWSQLSPSTSMWGPEMDSGYRAHMASTLHAKLSSPSTHLLPHPFNTNALCRKGKVCTTRNLKLRCKKVSQPPHFLGV